MGQKEMKGSFLETHGLARTLDNNRRYTLSEKCRENDMCLRYTSFSITVRPLQIRNQGDRFSKIGRKNISLHDCKKISIMTA